MRPRTQKQPQVKKELCRALDDVDVDVELMAAVLGLRLTEHFLETCVSRPPMLPFILIV